MSTKKFRLNQRVVPISKTSDGRIKGLENSVCWNRAKAVKQPYLFITRNTFDGDYPEYMASPHPGKNVGDYFHERDLIPYKRKKIPPTPKDGYYWVKRKYLRPPTWSIEFLYDGKIHNERGDSLDMSCFEIGDYIEKPEKYKVK